MRRPTLRFALLALWPAWLVLLPSVSGQDEDNPIAPPPAVPLTPLATPETALAPPATPSKPSVIHLPPVEVTAAREQPSAIRQAFEKLNHVFDGPFPSLRSGPLIEAILWRHRYLTEHPNEQAAIVTTGKGQAIRSATTVYTRNGRVYGSSNALGENLLLANLSPADLNSPEGLAKAKNDIVAMRSRHGDATAFKAAGYLADGRADTSAPAGPLGQLLVAAEDSGNYRALLALTGPVEQFQLSPGAAVNMDKATQQMFLTMLQGPRNSAHQALGLASLQAFAEPSPEILSWTYQTLHDPARAGLIPVALTQVRVKGSIVTVSPFVRDNLLQELQTNQPLTQNILAAKKGVAQDLTAIVFDWAGVQYLYNPDVGTQAKPLPLNPVTGLPYLCLKGGALMECAYFCTTYVKQHPDEKAVLLTGDPVLSAYQADGKLKMFIPSLGRFTLPQNFTDAIDDAASLRQLRDQLVALQQQNGARPDAIPDQVAGDDAGLQLRRAFLAFQAAGIPCEIKEDAAPSLSFTLNGVAYVYGPDQQVRAAPGG